MSYYPNLDDYNENNKEKIIYDLSLKKEFFIYSQHKKELNNTDIDEKINKSNILILNSYQTFIENFLNINTPYTRLLLVHQTGVGKTLTSLKIAYNFINYYNKVDKDFGNIIILGFTKNIFKKELLRPEFGIITQNELNELIKVKQLVSQYNLQRDIEYLKELRNKYNRRILKKNIKFYGYKEFVGKLFKLSELDDNIKLTDLKEHEILKYLKENKIKLNEEILSSFKNSLLICDEIHNVYNSLAPNNWGVALQIILDFHSQYGNTLRSIFLSATPINNHYIEIVNLINLLTNYDKKIHKSDLFNSNNKFLHNSLDKIKNSIINKVSYIKDINTQLYPSSKFIGNEIKDISYLKFIRCPMSKFHYNTYKHIFKEKNELTLTLEQIYINDYVLPNPDDNNIGIYKSIDINNKIRNASNKWKDKYKIKFINKKDNISNYELSGNFLLKQNIRIYSEKYYQMLHIIDNIIINKKGKIFLYHNFVNNSGILFIQEILKINGYLDKNSSSTLNTKCTFCNNIRKNHENNKLNHEFKPIRFIIINSEIQKNIIENDIDMFNLTNNANGDEIRIILGSRAIKESYDLKAIRNILILSAPDNISTLIQIIGRAIRKNSHIDLNVIDRHVDIYILVNSLPNLNQLSYEELKYKNKIEIHKDIQKIENIFINNSIESLINQNIYNTHLNNDLFPNNNNKKLIELKKINLNLNTFFSYHIKTEINNVKYIIKRLFLEVSNIWDYNELYKYVLNPPFNIEFDTTYISEDSFINALDFLIYKKNNIELLDISTQNLITNLFDSDNKIIVDKYGNNKIILYINKYYILTNYNIDNLIYLTVDEPFREHMYIKKKKILLNDYINDINNINNNYTKIKEHIINKYYNYEFKNLLHFIDEYDVNFHINFIKELIEYFYNLYTNKQYLSKDINHDFYLKMLYYYNKFNIIIFANQLDNENYKNYELLTVKDKKNIKIENLMISSLEEELINSSQDYKLKQNLQIKKNSIYKQAIIDIGYFLNKKKNKFIKINDTLLPVGYHIDEIPQLYTIENKWFDSYINYIKNKTYIENDIIIGYSTKDKSSIEIKFKLRPPKIKNEYNDLRKVYTGVVCSTKDKDILLKILFQLNPKLIVQKISKIELCNLIKRELIINELKERRKKSNIKWYYNIFEQN